MDQFRRHLLLLLVVGLAAALIGARARVLATQTDAGLGAEISLAEIAADPERYRGRTLTFLCRFAAPGRLFRTNDAVFNAKEFENFAVWADEARLWEKDARAGVIPGFYISREDDELLQFLRRVKRYDRLRITGEIAGSYARLPWIRVTVAQVIPGQGYTEEMLAALAQGEELLKAGKKTAAEERFRQAAKNAPEGITAFAAARIAQCLAADPAPVQPEGKDGRKLWKAGQAALARGEWAQALGFYKEAGGAEAALTREAAYWREFGELYLAAAKDAASVAAAKKCLEEANRLAGGRDAQALVGLARVAMAGRDWPAAEALVTQSLAMETDNSSARRLLLQILSERLTQERAAEGNRAPVAAARVVSAAAGGRLAQAKLWYLRGELTAAEELLREVAQSPEGAQSRETTALLASVLLAQGRAAEAGALLARQPSRRPEARQPMVVAEAAPVLPAELPAKEAGSPAGAQGVDFAQAEKEFAATTQTLTALRKELEPPVVADKTPAKPESTGAAMLSSPAAKQPKRELKLPDIPSAQQDAKKAGQLPDWAL